MRMKTTMVATVPTAPSTMPAIDMPLPVPVSFAFFMPRMPKMMARMPAIGPRHTKVRMPSTSAAIAMPLL